MFMKEGYCCFLLFTSYSHSCWYVIGVSSILLFNRGPTIVPLNAGYVKISHGIRYFLTSYIWLVNDGLWYWVFPPYCLIFVDQDSSFPLVSLKTSTCFSMVFPPFQPCEVPQPSAFRDPASLTAPRSLLLRP